MIYNNWLYVQLKVLQDEKVETLTCSSVLDLKIEE